MKNYINLLRISHWVKNLFVFVPLIFSKNLTDKEALITVLLAFAAFSLASSIVYIINDIADIENDRAHPVKKNRPLASRAISVKSAIVIAVALLVMLVVLLSTSNKEFIVIIAGYTLLNVLYSLRFKKIVIVDIMSIATGFMLRIIGGALVIDVYISNWLILTTLFLSLFLAIMKRKSEIQLNIQDSESRKVLKDYTVEFINQLSAISAAGIIICYALYSVSDRTTSFFGTENLVFTTIFVIFGVFRYMFLAYSQNKGESTIEILISDIPTIVNTLIYILVVILIIY
jgi:4-hydroxybenzoate polyprenyltransferase